MNNDFLCPSPPRILCVTFQWNVHVKDNFYKEDTVQMKALLIIAHKIQRTE